MIFFSGRYVASGDRRRDIRPNVCTHGHECTDREAKSNQTQNMWGLNPGIISIFGLSYEENTKTKDYVKSYKI